MPPRKEWIQKSFNRIADLKGEEKQVQVDRRTAKEEKRGLAKIEKREI